VKTVGLLAVGSGTLVGREATRRRPDPVVGIAAAVPFALASGWYGGTGRISRVYLADAVLEGGFALAWLVALRGGRRR
jgi:hypothetical protein